jgi:tetratricopeptide (TPR) repeat protein
MESVPRGDAEIVLGLARAYSFQGFTDSGDRVGGLANYRGGYVVLMISGQLGAHQTPVEGLGVLLAHELAHIFGAVHRDDPDLLLARGGTGVRVDALNAALMGMHRKRRFQEGVFPLPVPYHEAARPLYRRAIEEDPSDLNSRLMLARLDVETGRYAEAISALEEILAESPGNLEARGDLELALELQRMKAPTLAQLPGATIASMRELSPPSFFNDRKVRTCS